MGYLFAFTSTPPDPTQLTTIILTSWFPTIVIERTGCKIPTIIFEGSKLNKSQKAELAASFTQIASDVRYGTAYPWSKDKNVMSIACPDPENHVVIG